MTLLIELTAASSNLPSYLAAYDANFSSMAMAGSPGHSLPARIRWPAGFDTEGVDNNIPSVIMEINDYSYLPGLFNGDVSSLTLGRNLEVPHAGQDPWVQDEELIITNEIGYMPDTTTFAYAIYSLSHWRSGVDGLGTFPGLTDYFAEQGTIQVGKSRVSTTRFSASAARTLSCSRTGPLSTSVNSFDLAVDVLDVSAWAATALGDWTLLPRSEAIPSSAARISRTLSRLRA